MSKKKKFKLSSLHLKMFSIGLLLTGLLTGFASAPPSVELGSIVFREKKGTCYTNHIHRAIESKAAHLPSNTLKTFHNISIETSKCFSSGIPPLTHSQIYHIATERASVKVVTYLKLFCLLLFFFVVARSSLWKSLLIP